MAEDTADKFYATTVRYAGRAFLRHKLGASIGLQDAGDMWTRYNEGRTDREVIDRRRLRGG